MLFRSVAAQCSRVCNQTSDTKNMNGKALLRSTTMRFIALSLGVDQENMQAQAACMCVCIATYFNESFRGTILFYVKCTADKSERLFNEMKYKA